jgi:hypothetical protein
LPDWQVPQEEEPPVRLFPELTALTSEIWRFASKYPQLGQLIGASAWLKGRIVSKVCLQD